MFLDFVDNRILWNLVSSLEKVGGNYILEYFLVMWYLVRFFEVWALVEINGYDFFEKSI